jgi:ribA/ribD-fused uncharacterized protein
MTSPIPRNQNIPSLLIVQPTNLPIRKAVPPSPDTLRMANASESFSLWTIWESIVNCFKSIFSCFFKTSIPPSTTLPTNSRDRIAAIAARDHFVWFYKQEENPTTAFLGNFHPCQFHIYSMRFQCAEAAYQALKFVTQPDLMDRFQDLDGEAAFQLGQELSRNWTPTQVANWRARSVDVMRGVLTEKFSQNPDLKELLLATGNAYLVEHVPVRGRDSFWGDDFDGGGVNMLGMKLMQVRHALGGVAGLTCIPREYDQFIRAQIRQ